MARVAIRDFYIVHQCKVIAHDTLGVYACSVHQCKVTAHDALRAYALVLDAISSAHSAIHIATDELYAIRYFLLHIAIDCNSTILG